MLEPRQTAVTATTRTEWVHGSWCLDPQLDWSEHRWLAVAGNLTQARDPLTGLLYLKLTFY